MARVKFYLDTRGLSVDGKAHVKISLSHNKTSALIPTSVLIKPEYWDPGDKNTEPHVKKTCPGYKAKNTLLESKLSAFSDCILLMEQNRELGKYRTATELKKAVLQEIEGESSMSFTEYYRQHIEKLQNAGTKRNRTETFAKLNKFTDGKPVQFSDINARWLQDFDRFMSDLKVNARSVHMRNIRAVLNDAIDDEVVGEMNPFRRFKIKQEATRKRSLTIDQLRQLRDHDCEPEQRQYRDIFMLIFYLRGINIGDLCNLKEITPEGYVEYRRAKTGRLFKVKVEPEAREIIKRYRGKKYLLNILDRYKDYKNYLHRLNKNLKEIGSTKIVKDKVGKLRKKEKTGLFPDLSTYWARHTFASLAVNIGIPIETVSAALGHEVGSRVTAIYVAFDQKKIDEANRKVLNALKDEPQESESIPVLIEKK